jgi:hypothetical protein
MAQHSEFLSSLDKDARLALERRLLARQTGHCFICDEPIDLVLHHGQLDIDHIDPLSEEGADHENNFALTHASCNRSKGASDLRVARRMAEFEKLQEAARERGERGAHLGHVLGKYGGAKHLLRVRRAKDHLEFALGETGDPRMRVVPIYRDQLSDLDYTFTVLPLEYLHHDDRINPRPIGQNIRGLIEEFMKKRPQLHVALAWWQPSEDGAGCVRVFDGQHKAAAQILLGVRHLPIRLFLEPDTNVLLVTNTNAGDKLRQVAFDAAVMRHLGSTLYAERARQYQQHKGLGESDYRFSEKDLVTFFRGEHREVLRYIVDAARDSITYNKDNRLMEFVEWSGKGADRPLAYAAVERTFFKEFICKKALETPIDEGMEQGANPRVLEREQLVQLMSLFADVFFVGQWDPALGGRRLEDSVRKGDPVPEGHLRAWRVAREEILGNIMTWLRLVIENYNAWAGKVVDRERLLHGPLPEVLWKRIEAFMRNLASLPCWVDKGLSATVFGAKQNLDFWRQVYETGKAPSGVQVLAKPLDLTTMIQNKGGW